MALSMTYKMQKAAQILSVGLLLFTNACSSGSTSEHGNPYDRLCVIYEEELGGKELSGPEDFEQLSDRVDAEVPELRNHHRQLADFPRDRIYPTLKELAESETDSDWECPFIEGFY